MAEEDKGHTGYLTFATLLHPDARVPLALRTETSDQVVTETGVQSSSS
jgi:hypothetical protein